MSNRRQAQVRHERKRRRREDRKKRRQRLAQPARPAVSSLQDEWSHTMVLSRDGRAPDPDRVAELTALGTMSDALLRLMEPYVWWPPHPIVQAEFSRQRRDLADLLGARQESARLFVRLRDRARAEGSALFASRS